MEVLSNGLPTKLLMLLLTVVMSTNMSGCRGTADAADTGQPPGVVAESTTVSSSYIKTKDTGIIIGKEKYTLPLSVSMLGNEFTTDKKHLYYNNVKIATIDTQEDKIIGFNFLENHLINANENGIELNIYGVNPSISEDELFETIGTPTETIADESKKIAYYFYSINDSQYLLINFENDKINSIVVKMEENNG